MITTDMTVREVASEFPQSTRLFEKLKIDYCCGGNRPLTEACTSAGIDVDDLMNMLTEVTNAKLLVGFASPRPKTGALKERVILLVSRTCPSAADSEMLMLRHLPSLA